MSGNLKDEKGMTLVEVMIAILILLSGLLVMAQVMAFSVIASKTMGRDAGKTTAAARDKMEELMGLSFSDVTTNVTVAAPFPATGLGLTAGGSVYPADPVDGYVDYINQSGVRGTAASAGYTRQWQIVNTSAALKTLIVSVRSTKSFRFGIAPSTTLITQKASPGQ
jgi:prepilin-type N-terminal cleavage/methylation domain-containing protein